MSAREPKVYRATADVLLNRQDLAATITGLPTQSTVTDPVRYARTQASLAAGRRRSASAPSRSRGLERRSRGSRNSDVAADPDTDILTFGVNHGDPDIATRLATAYARRSPPTSSRPTRRASRAHAERSRAGSRARAAGATGTETYRELLGQAQDLRTLELLLAPATVIRAADGARADRPDAAAQRDPRRAARARARTRRGVRAQRVRPAHSPRRRGRATSSRSRFSRSCRLRGAATRPTILERPPDEIDRSGRATPRELRLHEQEPRREDRDGHERRPARGQVDDDREPRDRTGPHGPARRARRPRPSAADAQPHSSIFPTDRASPTSPRATPSSSTRCSPSASRRFARGSPRSVAVRRRARARLEVITTGRTRVEPAAFVESERPHRGAPDAPEPRRDRSHRRAADPRDRRLDGADRQGRRGPRSSRGSER